MRWDWDSFWEESAEEESVLAFASQNQAYHPAAAAAAFSFQSTASEILIFQPGLRTLASLFWSAVIPCCPHQKSRLPAEDRELEQSGVEEETGSLSESRNL